MVGSSFLLNSLSFRCFAEVKITNAFGPSLLVGKGVCTGRTMKTNGDYNYRDQSKVIEFLIIIKKDLLKRNIRIDSIWIIIVVSYFDFNLFVGYMEMNVKVGMKLN